MQAPNDNNQSSTDKAKATHDEAKKRNAERLSAIEEAKKSDPRDIRIADITKEIKRLHQIGIEQTKEGGSRTRTIERGGEKKTQTVNQATIMDEIDRFSAISQQIKSAAVSDLSIKDALDSIKLVTQALDDPDLSSADRKAQVKNLDVAEQQLALTDADTLPEEQKKAYLAERNRVQEEINNFRDLASKGTKEFSATKEFVQQQKDDAIALVIGKLTNNPLFAVGYKLFSDYRKVKKRKEAEAKGRLSGTRREKVSALEAEKESLSKVEKISDDTKEVSKADDVKKDIPEYEIILPLDKNQKFIDVMRESIEQGIRNTLKTATGEAPKVIPEQMYTDMFNDRQFVEEMAGATLEAIKAGDVVVEGADADTFKQLLDTGLYQNELTQKLVEGFFGEELSEMFTDTKATATRAKSQSGFSSSVELDSVPLILEEIKVDTEAIKVAVEKLVDTFSGVEDETKKSRVLFERADKRAQENKREESRDKGFTAQDYVRGKVDDMKKGFMGFVNKIRGIATFLMSIPLMLGGFILAMKGFIATIAPFARIIMSFAKRLIPIGALFKGVYDAFTGWADTEGEDLPVRIASILKDLAGGILSFFSFGLINGDTLEKFGKFLSDGLFDIFSDGGYIDKAQEQIYEGLKKIPIVGSILGVFESILDWWKDLDIIGGIKRLWSGEKKESNTTISASVQAAKDSGALEGDDEITVKDKSKLERMTKYRLKSILKSKNLADSARSQIKDLIVKPKPKTEPVYDRTVAPLAEYEGVKQDSYQKQRMSQEPALAPVTNNYNSTTQTHVTKSVPVTSPLDTSARVQSDYL